MINVFKVRKWSSLLLCSFVTSITFYIGLIYYDFLISLLFLLGGALVSVVIANKLLQNPFTSILEGAGIMCIDMSSTGVLQPFIIKVVPPFVEGKFRGKSIRDVFNRSAVANLAAPKVAGSATFNNQGGIDIKLSEKEYNAGRFAMFHYPVILYNSQIKSIITKEDISNMEKTAFAEHHIIYLNRILEDLSFHIRDFGRYVVESIKPSGDSWYKNKWVIIIMVIIMVGLVAMFAPYIMKSIQQFMGDASGAIGSVGEAGTIERR